MAVLSHRFPRRRLLAGGGLIATRLLASDPRKGKGEVFESDVVPYADAATESQVYRLTDPMFTSLLPGPSSRIIARNSAMLLFTCDRPGTPQAFRLDLKSGDTQQLTDRPEIDPGSLTLLPDSRSFCYFAGRTLYVSPLATLRDRSVYTLPEGWELCSGLHAAADGMHVIFGEQRNGAGRLRVAALGQGGPRSIIETPFPLFEPMERPLRAQILYREPGKGLWLVNADGRQNRQLKLAPGGTGPAHWAADGKTLLYLNFPEDSTQLNTIREFTPDQDMDKVVAKTSQFASFGCNRDTSVFVGASRNAASPTVLLLLRLTRREFTLCEHRSHRPETVAPLFSPDAQRIYYQSEMHGKPALYSVHVERLVEKIDGETQ